MDKKDTLEEEEEILIEYDIQEKAEEIVEKKTNPILTLYEFSNLNEEEIREKNLISSYEIVREEFKQRKFPPFKIKKIFPNGRYELWDINEIKYFPEF